MKIENLIDKYKEVRNYSEKICDPLHVEDYIPQPVEFVSPPKWHLGHTTWFFEQFVLVQYSADYKVFNADFNFLFNSYYNTVGERVVRNQRGLLTRPLVEEIFAYRKYVDAKMLYFIENANLPESIANLIILGLNHEQQHQELMLTDLKYTFHLNPLFPVYDLDNKFEDNRNQEEGFHEITGGLYEIGYVDDGFCYDNELSPHKVYLNDFKICKALVTNGEYLEFVESGAYQQFKWWHDEAWHWINKNSIKHPMYWHKLDNQWYQFTLSGLKPINQEAILCHINYYEAAAFAEWKGMRLPTEFEWETACNHFNWGSRWEWTNSAYLPYPGYQKAEGAVGEYNGKFMLSQMVLRGASVATFPGHSRTSYRNFFHPHLGWQFTGIRLVQ